MTDWAQYQDLESVSATTTSPLKRRLKSSITGRRRRHKDLSIKANPCHHPSPSQIPDLPHQSPPHTASDRTINMVAFTSILAALMAAGSALALPTFEVPSENVTEVEDFSLVKRGIGQGTGK